MLQNWFAGHEAVEQQTKFTQWPELHSAATLHDAPFACGVGVFVGVDVGGGVPVGVGSFTQKPSVPGRAHDSSKLHWRLQQNPC